MVSDIEAHLAKLRNDFDEECDNIKELSDRLERVEETTGAQTDAIGSFRFEIEKIHKDLVDAAEERAELLTRIQVLEDRHSKHSHTSQSHSHLGVEEELQRLNKCVDELNDNLQSLKENVFGADDEYHSSFFREVLDLRGRVAVVEVLAKQAVVELDRTKTERIVRLRKGNKND